MQFGCLLPWTEVPLIIEIYAVSNRIKATLRAQLFHGYEEFILALKAALAVVANIVGTIEFRGIDHFKWKALFIRERNGIGQLRAGEAGGICDDRQHLVSQSAVRSPGEICGIHASGICHQQTAKSKQLALELG